MRPLVISSCADCGHASLGVSSHCSRCIDRVRYLAPRFRATSAASNLAWAMYISLGLAAVLGALGRLQ